MFFSIKKLLDTALKEYKVNYMKLVLINWISLSCFDDKRYVLDNGINTLAYFHKDIVSS